MKVASLNVRGLTNAEKRCVLFDWAYTQKIDILCLQETFCTLNSVDCFNKDWNGISYHALSDSPHSRGCAILIKKDFKFSLLDEHASSDGRRILINIKHNSTNYCLVNLYAPNIASNRILFLKISENFIREYSCNNMNTIVCGDFNCTLNINDRKSFKSDATSKHLKNLMFNLNLIDSFRIKNPDARGFTYFNSNSNIQSRIDYMLTSTHLNTTLQSVNVKYAPMIPDHKSVIASFTTENKRGVGFWKLNTSYLENTDYINGIKKVISDHTNTSNNYNDAEVWDFCKLKIKHFSIAFAKETSLLRDNDIRKIESELIQLDKSNTEITHLQSELQKKLDKKYMEKVKGAQIRSRIQWVAESEKNIKFFQNLEQNHQTNNIINCLLDSNQQLNKDNSGILSTVCDFYKKLYSSKNIKNSDIDEYVNKIKTPYQLQEHESSICDSDLTIEECFTSLSEMKKNKSPGHDGLPMEFYLTFWDDVKQLLLNSYKHSFENEKLPLSHRESLISLIHKKNDRSDLRNYRPISLSNVDYKILALTLANRVHNVLPNIVSAEQTAYVKKRFIGENIRHIQDVIHYTTKFNIPGIILFLDFEKAFDSLEWNFMSKCLQKFGFGKKFCKWVKIIYSNPVASIKVNGFLTKLISIERGIKQGCPLSALLFIICTEILGLALKQNSTITKLPLPNSINNASLVSQFADDLCLFLKSEIDVLNSLNEIISFGNVSGLKLNIEKTEAMWLGPMADSDYKPLNLKWVSITKYLGIFIGTCKNTCEKKNWENKLEKFQRLLDVWKLKNLTLFSKIDFLKTYALSKFTFLATMIEIPDSITNNIEKAVYKFIWGKKDKIRRRSLICPCNEGGANMLDIREQFLALKAPWISKIITGDLSWQNLARFLIEKIIPLTMVIKMSFSSIKSFPILKKLPEFYQEALLGYTKSKFPEKIENKKSLMQQIIWGNRQLMNKNLCLYSREMIEANIIYITDVYDASGKIRSDVYEKLPCKFHYFRDITLLQKTVSPFKEYFREETIENLEKEIYIPIYTSKPFYIMLRDQKKLPPKSLNFWVKEFPNFTFTKFYELKLKHLHIAKIKEFMYKIINNICPCMENLYKWGISLENTCIYCLKNVHNIKHMLFECDFVKMVWRKIEKILSINITYELLILGKSESILLNNVMSIILYIIYKKFIEDNNVPCKKSDTLLQFIAKELVYRKNIYESQKELSDMLYTIYLNM